MRNIKSLIGLTLEEAKDKLLINKTIFRIIREDDIYFIFTCDLQFNRVNIAIDNGTVTEVYFG